MKCFTSGIGASKLVINANTTVFLLDPPLRNRRALIFGK